MKVKLIILLSFALPLLAFANGTKYDAVIKAFKAEFPQYMEKEKVPGFAIAITNKEEIIWSETFGYTDNTQQTPITTKTNFSLQSASKAFTSLAILLATQEGKIDLHAPISKYLDDFSVNSIWDDHPENKITTRHLLSHTSGLGHETAIGNNYDLTNATYEGHVESIYDTWLKFPTGQRQTYSNLGISIAGDVLQKSMNKPLTKCLEEMILNPLGMNSSTYYTEKIRQDKNRAMGHSNTFSQVPEVPNGVMAAGGLYSNIEDLAKFARFILNKGSIDGKEIIKPSYFDLLTTLPFKKEGQQQGFGLGLETKNFGGYEIYMMPGRGFGFLGGIVYFPKEEIALIVLANNEDTNIPMMAIFTLVQFLAQQETQPQSVSPVIPDNLPQAEVTAIEKFAGEYLGAHGSSFVLNIEESNISITINGEPTQAEILNHDGQLYAKTGNTLFRLVHDQKNKMKYVVDVYDSEVCFDFNVAQNEETGKFKSRWNKYLGDYYLEKWGVPFEEIKVQNVNGYLYLNNKKLKEIKKAVFMNCNGEVLDFSEKVPTYKSIQLHKN